MHIAVYIRMRRNDPGFRKTIRSKPARTPWSYMIAAWYPRGPLQDPMDFLKVLGPRTSRP